MSPLQFWNKIVDTFSSQAQGKTKKPLKNLMILLGLGVALMLVSHFFSGSLTKSPTKVTSEPSSKETSSAVQEASLLKKTTNSPQTMDDFETYYEERLTSMLDSMAGISNAKVLITLSSGPENIYQQNTQTSQQKTTQKDSSGGTSTTTNESTNDSLVTVDQGNGQNGPLLVTQKGPTVDAILIVANGVTQPAAQERVVNAVSTVLDVPSYKVSVQERK